VKLFDFMVSEEFCGSEFTGPSWATWRIVARLFDGDAALLTPDELALAKALTGREVFPTSAPPELYIGAGRRSGKTRFAALLAVYASAQDYELPPGGFAVAAVVAPDRKQAQLAFSYARGLVEQSELLAQEIGRPMTESLEFKHSTKLEVLTGNFRAVRGYSTCLAIVDESAFFQDAEGHANDEELARALRPALATLNGTMVVISSPHRRRGILFDAYERYFGHDDQECLYIQAESTTLNPTLNQAAIDRAIAADPEGGKAEWLGLFRGDECEYLPDDVIDAAPVPDRLELPHQRGRVYSAFVDLAGGAQGGDSAALAIAHKEPGTRAEHLLLDQLYEVAPPHKPAEVVRQFAAVLQRFGISSVLGDRYAAEWPVNAFSDCGISYQTSELNRSAIYGEVAPLFMDRRVELLDHKKLIAQLRGLERIPKAGGRPDEIRHGPRRHDDLINAVAGALWLASIRPAASDEYGEGNVTHADTNYDVLERDSGPQVRRSRHPDLLPANLRMQVEDDFLSADRVYDPLGRD
jgi:hypothetical protein